MLRIVKIKSEDRLAWVRKSFSQKYLECCFVQSYHNDKKTIHLCMHCLICICGDTNKTIDIRKSRLDKWRTVFCIKLQAIRL